MRRTQERVVRGAFFQLARGLSPYVAVRSREDGALFFVRTDDVGVGRGMFVRRGRSDSRFADRAVACLAEHGHRVEGGVLVEVGANIGTTTVHALRALGFARAVVCEPAASNYELLRVNLAANGVDDRVVALPLAVSNEPGELPFDRRSGNSGAFRLVWEGEAPPGPERVRTTTLDALAERGVLPVEQAALLWIDAQGQEGHVLDGARRLLAAGVPVVTALRPRRLERSGGLPLLLDAIAGSYTHVLELRGGRLPDPVEASRVEDVVRRCRRRSSDLLAFRC